MAPQESPLITRALPPQRPCLAPVPCPQFFFVQIFSSKFFSSEFFSSEFFDRNFFSVAAAAGAAATDEKCEMRKVFRAKSIWTRRYVRKAIGRAVYDVDARSASSRTVYDVFYLHVGVSNLTAKELQAVISYT